MTSDIQLLRDHHGGSKTAFADLMRRHVDWVYSIARRHVRDPHLAEDITQAVFIALAQSRPFDNGANMSAWLFGVVRNTSAKALRTEARRRRHEARHEALVEQKSSAPADEQWEPFCRALDDLIVSLPSRDAKAVLLRFYQQKSHVEVGAALGISEEGARKRINRALEKLRNMCVRNGLVPASEAGLLAHAITAAPAGLVDRFSMGSTLKISASSAGSSIGWFGWMTGAAIIGCAVIATTRFMRPDRTTIAATPPPSTQAVALNTTRPTNITCAQIIAGIEHNETAIHNLTIKNFVTTVDERTGETGDWHTTPIRYVGSAWYGDSPFGNRRIDFSELVMKWVQGTAPWSDESCVLSWDGKEGRDIKLTSGTIGHQTEVPNAIIIAEPPGGLNYRFSRIECGAAFSLKYMLQESEDTKPPKPHKTLSQRFHEIEAIHDIWAKPEIIAETVNGIECVRVKWKYGNEGWDAYWFDPARGFAIVKQESILDIEFGKTKLKLPDVYRDEGFEVSRFVQVAPSLWVAIEGRLIYQEPPIPSHYLRYHFRAESIVANDNALDPAIFRAPIPAGYLVIDGRSKPVQLYRQIRDGTQEPMQIGKVIPPLDH